MERAGDLLFEGFKSLYDSNASDWSDLKEIIRFLAWYDSIEEKTEYIIKDLEHYVLEHQREIDRSRCVAVIVDLLFQDLRLKELIDEPENGMRLCCALNDIEFCIESDDPEQTQFPEKFYWQGKEKEKEADMMCKALEDIKQMGIREGEARGEARIIANMYKKGFTLEQIADVTGKDVEEVKTIVENKETALI